MARKVLVIALVLFAVFSYACAETAANAPVPDGDDDPAANAVPSMGPSSDDHIGTDDDDEDVHGPHAADGPSIDEVVEGPVGGPGGFSGDASPPHSSASALRLPAFAAVAFAAAPYFF